MDENLLAERGMAMRPVGHDRRNGESTVAMVIAVGHDHRLAVRVVAMVIAVGHDHRLEMGVTAMVMAGDQPRALARPRDGDVMVASPYSRGRATMGYSTTMVV